MTRKGRFTVDLYNDKDKHVESLSSDDREKLWAIMADKWSDLKDGDSIRFYEGPQQYDD